ncbi:MAG: DoxX family protein [Candidatus Sericytochromatia bacterium]
MKTMLKATPSELIPALQAKPLIETELPNRRVQPGTQDPFQGLGLLMLRLGSGSLMLMHGWPKLMSYSENAADFADPLGIGGPMSLALVIFAEVICALLVMAGLTTRLASLVLVINFAVIVQIVHGAHPIAKKELAIFYLLVYAVLLLTGPGRFSIDSLVKRLIDKGALPNQTRADA